MEKIPRCAICGTTQQLLRCAKCKSIFYCSTAHQHMDWAKHKQSCRMLAKQKNDNRMQHLQQAVAATTLNNTNNPTTLPTMTNNINSGNQHWPTPTSEAGIIGFGLIDGNESAEVDPSILTTVPPITSMMEKHENFSIYDQSTNMVNENNHIPVSDTGGTSTGSNLMQNSTTSCMQPHYHNVNKHLLSPQYHQQQQQLKQNQLQCQQIPPTHTEYAQATNFPTHNRQLHYEKSISCQVGSGGGVDENAFGNANERRYDDLCRNIINDMNQYGLSVVDDFLGVEKGLQILNEVHRMYSAGVFKDGQLVNNLREEELRTIRGDKITWVKGVEPGCANVGYLINQIDAVICRANTMKNNGQLGNYNIKERTKAMVACYPGSGSHYVVHVDNPNKDGRVITAIYYLNVNWDTERSGGVLRIFPEHGNSVADIEPKFDRLIFFWSDRRNPHEVQPSHRTRYAITVWYFDANEREAALNRIKNNKNNVKLATDITTNANTTIGGAKSMASSASVHDNHANSAFTNPQINTTNVSSSAALESAASAPTPTLPTTSANIKTLTNVNSKPLTGNGKCASINNSTANTIEKHTVNSNNTALANSSEICT